MTSHALSSLKVWRSVNIGAVLVETAIAILNIITGNFLIALIPGSLALLFITIVIRQTNQINRLERQPDYAAIAHMELDIYGEKFYHDGSEY